VYLFDCGEGTQVPYKEAHLGLRALEVVAITHLHADHCLGLPGMLMLRAQMPDPAPLTLLGPPGLERFVDDVRSSLAMYINYEIRVRHWSPAVAPGAVAFEDERLRIRWWPLDHRVTCLGYRVEEHERPGKFDPDAAHRLQIPPGPLWGALQRGETVTGPGGQSVNSDHVVGPRRRGRWLAFITDTAPCPSLGPLLQDVDLALVEGMFLEEHAEDAAEKKHMTVGQAAAAAAKVRAKRLVVLHISPRYERRDLGRFATEGRAHHPDVLVPRDGQVITVPLPDGE
jgi:ribonuclease Z